MKKTDYCVLIKYKPTNGGPFYHSKEIIFKKETEERHTKIQVFDFPEEYIKEDLKKYPKYNCNEDYYTDQIKKCLIYDDVGNDDLIQSMGVYTKHKDDVEGCGFWLLMKKAQETESSEDCPETCPFIYEYQLTNKCKYYEEN